MFAAATSKLTYVILFLMVINYTIVCHAIPNNYPSNGGSENEMTPTGITRTMDDKRVSLSKRMGKKLMENGTNPDKNSGNMYEQFDRQVGGHMGELYYDNDNKWIVKPCTKRESEFYLKSQQSPELKSIVPKFYGTREMEGLPSRPNASKSTDKQDQSKMETSTESKTIVESSLASTDTLTEKVLGIALQDLTADLIEPCIIDIKIGKRLYDDDASEAKKARMIEQARLTTSGSLGLRICGMRVHRKEFGKSLTNETFGEGIKEIFLNSENRLVDKGILESTLSQLENIYQILSRQRVRLFGSSLLVIYEGYNAWDNHPQGSLNVSSKVTINEAQSQHTEKQKDESQGRVIIKLIDFAHSSFLDNDNQESGPDEGALFGIQNLIKFIRNLI